MPEDELTTLLTVRTEFEANAIVALLESEGVEAFAFGTAHQAFGISLERGLTGVPVQVRREDEARAAEIIERRRAEADDIDWDDVELGERDDALVIRERHTMPLAARIAMWVTIVVAVVAIIGMLVMALFPWPKTP